MSLLGHVFKLNVPMINDSVGYPARTMLLLHSVNTLRIL